MFTEFSEPITVGHLVTAVMFMQLMIWTCSSSIVRAIERKDS